MANEIYAAFDSSKGSFKIKLFAEQTPNTVNNFVSLADGSKTGTPFYDGTIFHRVIPGFMIQGGGMTADMNQKPTKPPIKNEADNGLKNTRGTVAMARTGDPHSATAQFFVNVVDNAFLDHTSKDDRGWGYCVFGKVIEGMEAVDKIRTVKTGAHGPFSKDAPDDLVVISQVKRRA